MTEHNINPGGSIPPDPYQHPIANIVSDLLLDRRRLIELLKRNNIDPKTGGRIEQKPKRNIINKLTKKLRKPLY